MSIKTKLLFVLTLLLLSSCTVRIKSRDFEENSNEPLESYRFVEFEHRYGYSLIYDRETGVEYFYAKAGKANSDYITPILDKDGKPKIHKGYYDAGSNVVCTNTFGANCLKFDDDELKTLIEAAVDNAKKARDGRRRS